MSEEQAKIPSENSGGSNETKTDELQKPQCNKTTEREDINSTSLTNDNSSEAKIDTSSSSPIKDFDPEEFKKENDGKP